MSAHAHFRFGVHALAILLLTGQAFVPVASVAGSLDSITSKDATGGLKAALSQAADSAVGKLGVTDGFLGNPKVAIPLPPALEKVERGLRLLGQAGEADALRQAMNHAAEAAVAEAKPELKLALQRMTVQDAKGILTGGENSATDYFRRTTSDSLRIKFKPIVARATARLKLAAQYDRLAGKAADLGLIRGDEVHVDDYVTGKALEGLYTIMADEERAIRSDPLGQSSALIKKVFGALK